ncbi:hypothetical protein J41TS2_45330 [Bacillus sonorensis]|nr:hypothetical protein J41TS2_45330 [Bacillus sonorensis]
MHVLEKNIFVLVNSCMINVNWSTGIGAKFVCKYVAVPNPITTKPIPKQTTLLYKDSGVTKECNKKSHISIPIPVINAVNNPKTSGFCLFKNELQHINMEAIIISQLPTVSPTFIDSPTKSASKGEVPKSDWIVKEIPRDNIKIPNT